MRTIKSLLILTTGVLLTQFYACKKIDMGASQVDTFDPAANQQTLKEAADFPIGVAIDYTPMMGNANYANLVKTEFDNVTFGYQMKHGAIVRDNGTMDFTRADALVNAVGGLDIYGHTLGWHQNQNATYLKSYAGITIPAATNLILNGDFEAGSGSTFTNWNVYNTNGATFSEGAGASEVHGGTRSLKVVNPNNNAGNQWRVQFASDLINTTIGTQYVLSFWVRSLAGGYIMRTSTQPTAQYQGNQTISNSWTQITWTFTAQDAQTRILFDLGETAGTLFIDDVKFSVLVTPPTGAQVTQKVDESLSSFITTTVNRYKNKVRAWDVVNELFTEDGNIRNNTNTPTPSNVTDQFVWSEYLGRDYALKAFNYAKAADPTALFFINDFNLESSPAKLDSLIKFVTELKNRGAKVDGIGTQMHISINTSFNGIATMFRKLAATGLKIKITELDIRVNPNNFAWYAPTEALLNTQAAMYKYVVQEYIRSVPADQRYGITIWGVDDPGSWIVVTQSRTDHPLLYDKDFKRKVAYDGVYQGLKK
ncbi:endo-1,4-beta-xylanase [Terrimonas ferruginea]|uniref:endo-1,4-beta-xylanase n=1 Tax=Terrimonas ferruginea TaxID=249 RepID=UPI00042229E7|nr:endo-1,4-beta-xylanase [Terrimonas ferruginea]